MRSLVLVLLVACGDHTTSAPDAAVEARKDAAIDAAPGGTYAAYSIIGGLDRLSITKTVGPTCFVVGLVSPGSGGAGDVALPANWAVEHVEARQPAAACNPGFAGPVANTYVATSRSGMIAWSGNSAPQTIATVQVTLMFANNPAWCPPSEVLATTDLMVQ